MGFPFEDCRTPVAVVAGIEVNGLGVVRSLGSAGVPVIAIDTDLTRPSARTRYGRKLKVPALSGAAFVESLLWIAGKLAEKPVLFLTQEDSVAAVAAAQDRLARSYRFSMPAPNVMAMLMDKALFQEAAEKMGSPVPRSLQMTNDVGLPEIERLQFPCVVKPLTKSDAYSAKFKKAYKVATARDVADLWAQARSVVDALIVQEWIEGGDSDVYFCLQYRHVSRPPVSFVGRKICQWPPLVGGTASCAPAPDHHDELVALTDAFFSAVGFVGLGSMEFKRDTRDGRFYMVEPTVGRTDYQEEIATLNGTNLPYAAWCGEIGNAWPPARTVRPPRVWRDLNAYRNARAAGAPDPLASVAPNARVVDAYFRPGDLLPYVSMALEPVRRRARRLLGAR